MTAGLSAGLGLEPEHFEPALAASAPGLAARLSALALLGMTVVIQLFVYSAAWATHLSWAGLRLYLVGRGAGAASLDRPLGLK